MAGMSCWGLVVGDVGCCGRVAIAVEMVGDKGFLAE